MTGTADTVNRADDRTSYQVDEAWLDEWPVKNFLGCEQPLPPGCSVTKTEDGILFTRN
jgi:hypothetical protein